MAGPWEAFATQEAPVAASAGKPWEAFAEATPKKSFSEKLGETWPAKLAKSVYSAVTLPGDVMAGKADVPSSENAGAGMGRVMDLATIGTPMAPKAAPSLAKSTVPAAEELKAAGSAGYETARGMGVELRPQSLTMLGDKIGAGLAEKGIDAILAPKTHGIVGKLAAPPADSVVTVSNLETLRRSLGHAAKDFTNPTEQLAAKRALGDLSDYMAAIPVEDVIRGPAAQASKTLKEATGNYAAAKRSEQITDAVGAADLNAAAANSGQNIGNATRQRIKSILASDKKSAGYSAEELAQMEKVVRGTKTGNTARILGNMMGGGGGLGSVVLAAAGAAVAPPLAALPVLGYGLKKASDASVQRQIRILDELVRGRSPLAGARPPAPGNDPKRAAMIRALMATENERRN